MRANEFITETINPDILKSRFRHQQEIGDFVLTAQSTVQPSGRYVTRRGLLIRCYQGQVKPSLEVGMAYFLVYGTEGGNQWLESDNTHVEKDFRGQNIASMMYAYAKMLGNDVKPSTVQLKPGKDMWKAWKKSGEAEHLMKEEINLPKNHWELLISNADKHEAGDELVNLVQQAYSVTPKGSMVNSLKDVIPSDWNVIDWDNEPDIDACVFYRRNRPNEDWVGYKIQGVGHDGTRQSKDKAIGKVLEMLQKSGVWIESSDAMRHVLHKLNAPSVKNEQFLQNLFGDSNLHMVQDDTYRRTLQNGQEIQETVFGHPKLK